MLVVALLAARSSHAGNAETFYLSGEAALTGGATTAHHTGAGSLWYNPSQLAEGTADSVDIAVSAYMVRLGGTPRLVGTDASAESYAGPLLQAIPTAASYARRIGAWDIAFGLFVPTVAASDPRSLARFGQAGPSEGKALLEASYERTEYYAGLGFGRRLTRTLTLGGSVFGYAATEYANVTFAAKDGDRFQLLTNSWDQQSYGLQLTTGLTYQPISTLRFGMHLRSPVVQLAANYEGSAALAVGDARGVSSALDYLSTVPNETRTFAVPPSLATGVTWTPDRNWLFAVDTRLRAPLSSDRERTLDGAFDVRLGARCRMGDTWTLGGGLYTDRSAVPARRVEDTALDYYGATLALELATPYRVVPETEVPTHARPQKTVWERLRVSSVFALSYAVGVGSITNVALDTRGSFSFVPQQQRAVAHQFVVTVSTTLANLLAP
jgi:hypothetical protein